MLRADLRWHGAMERWRIHLARVLAIVADLVQLGLWPVFGGGALSPFDDVLDVVLSGVMIWLVGWHWAFAPAFIAELVPGVDMAPTWTLAVLLATRGKLAPPAHTAEPLPAPDDTKKR